MTGSTVDIVLIAIGILAFFGLGIAVSAWRHAARIERELAKDDQGGLPSAI